MPLVGGFRCLELVLYDIREPQTDLGAGVVQPAFEQSSLALQPGAELKLSGTGGTTVTGRGLLGLSPGEVTALATEIFSAALAASYDNANIE